MGEAKREAIKNGKKKKPPPLPNPKYRIGQMVKWRNGDYTILHVDERPCRGVNNYALLGLTGLKYFIKEDEIS